MHPLSPAQTRLECRIQLLVETEDYSPEIVMLDKADWFLVLTHLLRKTR
jgi:hypothetical protein